MVWGFGKVHDMCLIKKFMKVDKEGNARRRILNFMDGVKKTLIHRDVSLTEGTVYSERQEYMERIRGEKNLQICIDKNNFS